MITAYISGAASRVVFVQGTDVSYFNADQPHDLLKASLGQIPRLLLNANDVEKMRVQERREVLPLLTKKIDLDRGLQLLDIALTDRDEDFRREAAGLLELILERPESRDRLRDYVLSAQNSELPPENDLIPLRMACPRFSELVDELRNAQVHILRFNLALERSLKALTISREAAEEFRSAAIDKGAFRALVVAGNDAKRINQAILSCYSKLKDVMHSRIIIQAWTRDVIHRTTRTEMRKLERELQQYELQTYVPRSASESQGFEVYRQVRQQMGEVVERMRHGALRDASRFADQLIKFQLQNGGEAYAAKTLSNLAVEARKLGQQSLELQWALASVQLMPNDGTGVGVLADTYLDLYRIPEAEEAFRRSSTLGEVEFGDVGVGRVRKASGRPDEALAIFKTAVEKFKSKTSPETYVAYAETLRELWRENDALDIYAQAIDRYPSEAALHCGKAAVLADMGDLNQAASIYAFVNERYGDHPSAWCGLASVRKSEGHFEEALRIYAIAKEKFPSNVVAFCGYADALRAKGNYDEALRAYRETSERFPFSPFPVSGYADTLKDMRRLPEALEYLRGANEKFPLNSRLRNSYATALKLDGSFEESLGQFERNVRDFPYDLYSLTGRAHLLRLLGNYDAALHAYDDIIDRRPGYTFASNAKASILVAQKRFVEAARLLPHDPPSTEDGWVTLHIRGMLALREKRLEEAELLITKGLDCPFYKQRQVFQTAYALLKLKQGDLETAQSNVATHKDNVSALLHVHILLKQGEAARARQRYDAIRASLPNPVHELMNRLERELTSRAPIESSVENWLFEREVEVILQAA